MVIKRAHSGADVLIFDRFIYDELANLEFASLDDARICPRRLSGLCHSLISASCSMRTRLLREPGSPNIRWNFSIQPQVLSRVEQSCVQAPSYCSNAGRTMSSGRCCKLRSTRFRWRPRKRESGISLRVHHDGQVSGSPTIVNHAKGVTTCLLPRQGPGVMGSLTSYVRRDC